MEIGTLSMDNFTEISLAGHVQCQQFKEIITAVLQHHAMLAGLFRCFHQLPAIFQRGGNGYFANGMLIVFHGIYRHGYVPVPWRTNIDQVNIIPFAYLLPGKGATRIGIRPMIAAFQGLLYFFDAIRTNITQRFDLYSLDMTHPDNSSGASLAQTNKSDPYSRSEEHTSELQSLM